MKGGFRERAGRPPSGIKKQLVAIKLRSEVANAMRRAIPERQRSAWVEALIERELNRLRDVQGGTLKDEQQ
jgi:hypothetical protein